MYHALINAMSAHMIHIIISQNTIFYRHVEHLPTKTIYIRNYMETHTHTHTHTTVTKKNSWGGNTVRRGRFSDWL